MENNSLVGLGLRPAHHWYFETHSSDIGWLEIHSENYFIPTTPLSISLEKIASHYPISCHGVGLSLGSSEHPSTQYLDQLCNLINRVQPIFISDHLSWSYNNGHYFNDLLPLPYTEEALDIFSRNVLIVQDRLKRPLLIENPSSYLQFKHSTIDEWTFLNEIQKRTDCRLLLDINNVYVSAFNNNFSPQTYLSELNASAVDEIHLAGFTKKVINGRELWIDTHNQPVLQPVWDLYTDWITKNGATPTLIEWDNNLPDISVLCQQAQQAQHILSLHNKELIKEAS